MEEEIEEKEGARAERQRAKRANGKERIGREERTATSYSGQNADMARGKYRVRQNKDGLFAGGKGLLDTHSLGEAANGELLLRLVWREGED